MWNFLSDLLLRFFPENVLEEAQYAFIDIAEEEVSLSISLSAAALDHFKDANKVKDILDLSGLPLTFSLYNISVDAVKFGQRLQSVQRR